MLSRLNKTNDLLNVLPKGVDAEGIINESKKLKSLINNAATSESQKDEFDARIAIAYEEKPHTIADLNTRRIEIDSIEEQIENLIPLNTSKIWWWFSPVRVLGYEYYRTLIQLFYIAPIEICRTREDLAKAQQEMVNPLFVELERYQKEQILPLANEIARTKDGLSQKLKNIFPETPKPRHWFLAIFRGQVKVKLIPKQKQEQKSLNEEFSNLLNKLFTLVSQGQTKKKEIVELQNKADKLKSTVDLANARTAFEEANCTIDLIKELYNTSNEHAAHLQDKHKAIISSIEAMLRNEATFESAAQINASLLILSNFGKAFSELGLHNELVSKINIKLEALQINQIKLLEQELNQVLDQANKLESFPEETFLAQSISILFKTDLPAAQKQVIKLQTIIDKIREMLDTYENAFLNADVDDNTKLISLAKTLAQIATIFDNLNQRTDLVKLIREKIDLSFIKELKQKAEELIRTLKSAVEEANYLTTDYLESALTSVYNSQLNTESIQTQKDQIQNEVLRLIASYISLPLDNSTTSKVEGIKITLLAIANTLKSIHKLPTLVAKIDQAFVEIEQAFLDREKLKTLTATAQKFKAYLSEATLGKRFSESSYIQQVIVELFDQHSKTLTVSLQPHLTQILGQIESLVTTYEQSFEDTSAKVQTASLEDMLRTIADAFKGIGSNYASLVEIINAKIASLNDTRELRLKTEQEIAQIKAVAQSLVTTLNNAPKSNVAIDTNPLLQSLDVVFKTRSANVEALLFESRRLVMNAVTGLADLYPHLHRPHAQQVEPLLKTLAFYFSKLGAYPEVVQLINARLENCERLLEEYSRVSNEFIGNINSVSTYVSTLKELNIIEQVSNLQSEREGSEKAAKIVGKLQKIRQGLSSLMPVIFGVNFKDKVSQQQLDGIRLNIRAQLTFLYINYQEKFLDLPSATLAEFRNLFKLAFEQELINKVDGDIAFTDICNHQDAIIKFKQLLKQISQANISESYNKIMAKAESSVKQLKLVFNSGNPKLKALATELISFGLVDIFNRSQDNIKTNPEQHLRVRDCCEGLFDILQRELSEWNAEFDLSANYDAVRDLRTARVELFASNLKALDSQLEIFRKNPSSESSTAILNLLKPISEYKVLYWQQPELKDITDKIRATLRGILQKYKDDYIHLESADDMYYLTDTARTSFAILNKLLSIDGIDDAQVAKNTISFHDEIRAFDLQIQQRKQRVDTACDNINALVRSVREIEPQQTKPNAININFNIFSQAFQCHLTDGRTFDLQLLAETLQPLGISNKMTLGDLKEALVATKKSLETIVDKENVVAPIASDDKTPSLINSVLKAQKFVLETKQNLDPQSSDYKLDVDDVKQDLDRLITASKGSIKELCSYYSIILSKVLMNIEAKKPQANVIETLSELTQLIDHVKEIHNKAVLELNEFNQLRFYAPQPISGKGAAPVTTPASTLTIR